MKWNASNLAWKKMNGLLPAVVQDAQTHSVLMLGYMNREALEKTMDTRQITFYSRSKNRLWTKGESSGNCLELVDIIADCDQDSLLILAKPTGPVCHKNTTSCFEEIPENDWNFIYKLEKIIGERQKLRPEQSYTTRLFNEGISRIAQKVGEESVEVVLAAIEKNTETFSGEVADLFFHILVLLKAKNLSISDIITILKERRKD